MQAGVGYSGLTYLYYLVDPKKAVHEKPEKLFTQNWYLKLLPSPDTKT